MTHKPTFSDHNSWTTALSAKIPSHKIVEVAMRGWLHQDWNQQRHQTYPLRVALSALAMAPEIRTTMRQNGVTVGTKVLDVGCGAGVISRFLWQEGAAEVIGVDNNEAMLAQAATLPLPPDPSRPLTFMKADLRYPLPFADNYFDIIWLGDFWLPNLMTELRRLLRPGGRIIFKSTWLMPRLTYSWDMSLDTRINAATYRGLQTWEDSLQQKTDTPQPPPTTLYGRLRHAGFDHIWSQLVERFAPVPPLLAEEMRQRFAIWDGACAWPYLDKEDQTLLAQLWQPDHKDYIFNRTDGHFTQTLTFAYQDITH